jgi:hypothetical protein
VAQQFFGVAFSATKALQKTPRELVRIQVFIQYISDRLLIFGTFRNAQHPTFFISYDFLLSA